MSIPLWSACHFGALSLRLALSEGECGLPGGTRSCNSAGGPVSAKPVAVADIDIPFEDQARLQHMQRAMKALAQPQAAERLSIYSTKWRRDRGSHGFAQRFIHNLCRALWNHRSSPRFTQRTGGDRFRNTGTFYYPGGSPRLFLEV